MSTPTLLAHPDSSVGKRAGFAQHNLWVTPYRADERRAAGELPEPARGRRRPPALDRARTASLVDTDVVLWYTFGVTHFVRPEDWPVMPVEYTGFLLTPVRLLRPQPRPRRPARRRTATSTPARPTASAHEPIVRRRSLTPKRRCVGQGCWELTLTTSPVMYVE